MQTYFSSDFHLGHSNIIKYDKRPFKNVEEMDHTIISNVTKQLEKGDILYYLGDFAMTRSQNQMEGYMKALAYTEATLFFIKGNHDKQDTIKLYKQYGTYLGEQKKIRISTLESFGPTEQEIVINHYAMRVWDKSHRGVWHLYGHSHHTLKDLPDSKSFDVGINGWDYKLITFDEIAKKMATKTYVPVDHHGKTGRE